MIKLTISLKKIMISVLFQLNQTQKKKNYLKIKKYNNVNKNNCYKVAKKVQ